MSLFFLILVSLLPALLWAYFFYRKDKFERESFRDVARVFSAGLLMVVPAGLLELPFRRVIATPSSLLEQILVSFLVIGLGEEFFKFLAVRLTVYNSPGFNEVMDGIIYGISAALGFSALENLLYTMTFGIQVAPLRAFLTSIAHASFSGIFGYYLGLGRLNPGGVRVPTVVFGLLLAAFLHGGYDFLLMAEVVSGFWALLMVGVLYWILGNRINLALRLSPFRSGDDGA